MVYHSPDGQQQVNEELVFFMKAGENGEPQMLQNKNGQPVYLNAALFDARFGSGSYNVNLDVERRFDVPHVNHEGKITKMNHIHMKIPLHEQQQMQAMLNSQPDKSSVIRSIQQKLAPTPPRVPGIPGK